ncbi:MAG: anthranilate synthase component I family protein, partial [Pseudomonadota bacterium]
MNNDYQNFLKLTAFLSKEPYTILFDSNRETHPDNQYSILCFNPDYIFEIKDDVIKIDGEVSDEKNFIDVLHKYYAENLKNNKSDLPFNGGLAGFFGYEFGCHQMGYNPKNKNGYRFPDSIFGLYQNYFIYDHKNEKFIGECENLDLMPSPNIPRNQYDITWEYSREDEEYLKDIEILKEEIASGEFYQVNLTRRLTAEKPKDFDSYAHYNYLREKNSAPFSAFANFNDFYLLSHSPERFLKCENGIVSTKPIKGTISSNEDSAALQDNPKERAENTMIVDLLRNDLSKDCKAHSVKVDKLCAIETFEGLHHLVSTISGEISDDKNIFDILKSCLPGGSITGAPKLAAIKQIDEIEPVQRGPYCGSLGYI